MKSLFNLLKSKTGFAIIEILIAITIFSIVLLGVVSGVSSGIVAIANNQNLSKAMIIAKNQLNDFQLNNYRGTDLKDEKIKEYPGFYFSREITRFEHELFGPLDAKRVQITVTWKEKNKKKNYSVSFIYSGN